MTAAMKAVHRNGHAATPNGRSAEPTAARPRAGEVRDIPIDLIDPHPDQPRKEFKDEDLASLSESLKKHGQLQPIVVRPKPGGRFELIAGERRFRAATDAGLPSIRATVRALADSEAFEIMLVENVVRCDLNPIEVARGLKRLCDPPEAGGLGKTFEQASRMFGRGVNWVAVRLNLLTLPEVWQRKVAEGRLAADTAEALAPYANLPDVLDAIEADMAANAWAWTSRPLVVRGAEIIAKRLAAEKRATSTGKASRAPGEPKPNGSAQPRLRGCRAYRDLLDVPDEAPSDRDFTPDVKELVGYIRARIADWPRTACTQLRHELGLLMIEVAPASCSKTTKQTSGSTAKASRTRKRATA